MALIPTLILGFIILAFAVLLYAPLTTTMPTFDFQDPTISLFFNAFPFLVGIIIISAFILILSNVVPAVGARDQTK